jgi:hypothetical protein
VLPKTMDTPPAEATMLLLHKSVSVVSWSKDLDGNGSNRYLVNAYT